MRHKKVSMVLNRKATLASTLGHIINFEKDVPIDVPEIVVRAAAEMGAVPVDQKVDPFEETKEEKAHQPVDPNERMKAISKVIYEIADDNVIEDFTAGGMPKVVAVSKRLGFKADRTEVIKAWRQRSEDLLNDSS